MIPVAKPYLNKETLKFAHEALDSTWISSQGEYLDKTSELLQCLLGVKYVLLTNNGTTATHLVAKALKTKSALPIKINVPANCYVAAWNSFLFDSGQYHLYPVDCNLDTWNYDMDKLSESSVNTDAILVVHALGNVIDIPKLKKKFPYHMIVEDNCEGLFGSHGNTFTGTQSLCSSVSFFANKVVVSGEGGAFMTNDSNLYEYAKLLRGQGQSSKKFIHNVMGYNYRMTNVEAAILFGQLHSLTEIKEKRNDLFAYYNRELNLDNVYPQIEEPDTISSKWMYGIRLDIPNHNYDKAEIYFREHDVEIRPMFYPINYHEYLKGYWGNFDNSKLLSEKAIILPSYTGMTKKEQDYVISTVKGYIKDVQ